MKYSCRARRLEIATRSRSRSPARAMPKTVAGLDNLPPVPGSSILGNPVQRLEDGPILRGRARYLDDLHLPGALHAVFVRSTVAHARLLAVDTETARSMPGVAAVFTAADLGLDPLRPMSIV